MTSIRETWQDFEDGFLSVRGFRSKNTKGRRVEEQECSIRTPFQRDRDRIIHCKSFRRLKHKTQVLPLPEGDHYRTRLTHTLEVSQIARTISRALRLNEDLAEAIALGHDLGHTPFGHMGESSLRKLCEENKLPPFHHANQSLRVVDYLEKSGKGLNLTYEVRMGIIGHSKGQVDVRDAFAYRNGDTWEGWVVRVSDSIAYLNHDLDDALRAGLIEGRDIPQIAIEELGASHSSRIDSMIKNVIDQTSISKPGFSEKVLEATETLRVFLYERVYMSEKARKERRRVDNVVRKLFEYTVECPEIMPVLDDGIPDKDIRIRALDFISGMTDRFALYVFEELFIPRSWSVNFSIKS